jgi:hypothetical protein
LNVRARIIALAGAQTVQPQNQTLTQDAAFCALAAQPLHFCRQCLDILGQRRMPSRQMRAASSLRQNGYDAVYHLSPE